MKGIRERSPYSKDYNAEVNILCHQGEPPVPGMVYILLSHWSKAWIGRTPRLTGYRQSYMNDVFTWVEFSKQKCSLCGRWLQRGALCTWFLPRGCWQKHPLWLRLLKGFAHGLLMRLELSSVLGCWKNSVQKDKGNRSYRYTGKQGDSKQSLVTYAADSLSFWLCKKIALT